MIQHKLWRTDGGTGYLPSHSDYEQRPWVLDSWDTEEWHAQRRFLPAEHTGLYLRSLKSQARIKIESLIAMEQYA